MADRAQLADFLRRRREALQPEDVGMPRGARRRTGGLRREEVAFLCEMSTDYYARLEQQRGPQPSEAMLAAIARGLRLSLDERDHLFRIGGHNTPSRVLRTDHVNPGLMRVLDRLDDTPAQVMTALGETLAQSRAAVALFGDETHLTGLQRSVFYRWFTSPGAREVFPEEDHPARGRAFTADLRAAYSRQGPRSRAGVLVRALVAASTEFAALWQAHEVGSAPGGLKRVAHPDLGVLSLYCQVLLDPDQSQVLLVYTATPGSQDADKLQLLTSLGERHLTS